MNIIKYDYETFGIPTSATIQKILSDEVIRRTQYEKMNRYYSGDVPILSRIPPDTIVEKTNNKLANDYAGAIVDSKTAITFGKDVKYTFSDATDIEKINKWLINDFYNSKNYNLGIMTSIYGKAYRLLYFDTNANIISMNLSPTETIVIYDTDTNIPDYALINYTDVEIVNGISKNINVVELYDSKNIIEYRTNAGSNEYNVVSVKPHFFSRVPVVEYFNNINSSGDFQKVTTLIDDYDRILSDTSNEIAEVGNAILAITGIAVTEEDIKNLKNMRYVGIPQEGKVEFITKNINNTFSENHLKNLRENIYRFSKCVDFSSESFSGASSSGEARKWQLLQMINDAKSKHQLFMNSEILFWKLISEGFNKKNITVELLEINPQIALPSDVLYESQILSNIWGKVSTQTAYEQMTFIKNPQKEAEIYENKEVVEGVEVNQNNNDII